MENHLENSEFTSSGFGVLRSPTGWGRQYYAGRRIKKVKNYRTDLFRPNEFKKMSFIQKFVAQHITGLKKRRRDGLL